MVQRLLLLLLLTGCGRTQFVSDSSNPVAVIDLQELTVPKGQWVTLDGSKSRDPQGEPLSFTWRILLRPIGANEQIESSVREVTRLRPDVGGAWRVELVVSAGSRRSAPAVATLTVTDPAGLPVAVAGPDQTGFAGRTFFLDGSLSRDPAGGPLSYAWSMTRPAGSTAALINPMTIRPSFTADRDGTYEVTLLVSARGRSASDSALIMVGTLNHAPIAQARSMTTGLLGSLVRLDGSGSRDPDGDPLTFSWRTQESPGSIPVILSDRAAVSPTFAPTVGGLYGFELTVSDPRGLSSTAVTSLIIDAPPDAGVDAGVRDAGVDAGVRDAGVDAGVRDAGIVITDGGGYDVLDPGEVYLAGTLSEGACWLDALAPVSEPNLATTGFDCYFDNRTAMIRPTDGRLIYTNTFEDVLREYHCDACPYTGNYGPSALLNDPIIPASCPGNGDLTAFRVSPDGVILHSCAGSPSRWRDAAGIERYDATGDPLIALGAGGWALTETRVVNLQTGEQHPFTGLSSVSPIAVRWHPPDGFRVAQGNELWRVSITGAAQSVGIYPAFPSGYSVAFGAKLDRNGALFQFARDSSFTDAIVRSTIGGTASVVYSELSRPLVKIHISALVTGP